MDLRQLARGTVSWQRLEGVGQELARRLDRDAVRIEILETDNWLSTPLVVDDTWFAKVITPQNALVHALLTGARNLGAITSGSRGFFDRFEGPGEMSRHEVEATNRMRDIGINAPQPVDAFEYEELGVVVLEYLPNFESYGDLSDRRQRQYASEILAALARMHEHTLVHGDLRDDNVLIVDDAVYFIDATAVQPDRFQQAQAYDTASVLAVLGPRIGYRKAVTQAIDILGEETVRQSERFLDFVNFRPDHQFDPEQLKAAIQHTIARA